MKIVVLWNIAKIAYATILRALVIKATSNPDEEWDEAILRMLDALFEYKETKP